MLDNTERRWLHFLLVFVLGFIIGAASVAATLRPGGSQESYIELAAYWQTAAEQCQADVQACDMDFQIPGLMGFTPKGLLEAFRESQDNLLDCQAKLFGDY